MLQLWTLHVLQGPRQPAPAASVHEQVQLWQPSRLVPYHLSGEDPSYFIIGGVHPTCHCCCCCCYVFQSSACMCPSGHV